MSVHLDRFDESSLQGRVDAYDERREARQPYETQRMEAGYGHNPSYGWSEDKARQYARPQRADFGTFTRGKRFDLS